mmetsp:Transcript_5607/g.16125  ORF Transcript_5607/g.16125 Transcript_5607/m.16125 type:complete len:278 (+) Transcript_5607:146-979(+)
MDRPSLGFRFGFGFQTARSIDRVQRIGRPGRFAEGAARQRGTGNQGRDRGTGTGTWHPRNHRETFHQPQQPQAGLAALVRTARHVHQQGDARGNGGVQHSRQAGPGIPRRQTEARQGTQGPGHSGGTRTAPTKAAAAAATRIVVVVVERSHEFVSPPPDDNGDNQQGSRPALRHEFLHFPGLLQLATHPPGTGRNARGGRHGLLQHDEQAVADLNAEGRDPPAHSLPGRSGVLLSERPVSRLQGPPAALPAGSGPAVRAHQQGRQGLRDDPDPGRRL